MMVFILDFLGDLFYKDEADLLDSTSFYIYGFTELMTPISTLGTLLTTTKALAFYGSMMLLFCTLDPNYEYYI